jgi:hypothetical protein
VNDAILVAVLSLAFAALVTVHVAIVIGLLTRAPRWRAALSLVVSPLAPYWAFQTGMRLRAFAWLVAASAYVAAIVVATR